MLNIAIIEVDKEYRDSFKNYFTSQSKEINCVFAVESVKKFLKYYNDKLELNVVLIDNRQPGTSGIKGVSLISKLSANLEIIILTAFCDNTSIFQSFTAGANGYLLKNLTFEEIETKLLDTLEDGAAISPKIARRIIEYFQPSMAALISDDNEQLTDKEKQIIQFVLDGNNYKEIAPLMGLSINGLKYHIKKIYKKIHVKSKTGIVKNFLDKKFNNIT